MRVPTETLASWVFLFVILVSVLTICAIQAALTASIALVWGSLIGITYHQGLTLDGDLSSCRSLNCSRFGLWVLNAEHRHAEHHAFPRIPGCQLESLAAIISPHLKKYGTVYESGLIRVLTNGIWYCPFSFLSMLELIVQMDNG